MIVQHWSWNVLKILSTIGHVIFKFSDFSFKNLTHAYTYEPENLYIGVISDSKQGGNNIFSKFQFLIS